MIVSAKKGNLSENGQDQSQKFAQKGFILFFKNFKEKVFFLPWRKMSYTAEVMMVSG